VAHNASVLAAEAADPLSETHYLSTPIEETFSYGRLPYPGCAFLRTHPNRFATLSRNATSRLPVEDALDRACPQSIMVASWWVLGIFGSFHPDPPAVHSVLVRLDAEGLPGRACEGPPQQRTDSPKRCGVQGTRVVSDQKEAA